MSEESRTSMLHITRGAVKDYTSAVFGDILDALSADLGTGNAPQNPKVLPFILTCAAALEAKLNDHFVSHAFDSFSRDHYKRVASAFLTMSLRGKLDVVVPTLTNSRFTINPNSKAYRDLSRLITVRNEIVHSKSFYEEIEIQMEEERIRLPEAFLEKLMAATIRKLSVEDCAEFHQAMKSLDTNFLYPLEAGTLAANDLILNQSKNQ